MRCFTGLKFTLLVIIALFSGTGAMAQVTTATFNCTGAPQNYTIPPCVTSVTVEAWGAGGGGGGIDTYTGSPGGGGAYAYSTLAVTPGQVLTVYVGCGGLQGGACQGNGPGGAGGYGYGSGGNGGNSGPSGCSGPGGGGGGGSAVLNAGVPLVVAGGGGGGGGGGNFGDGGNGGAGGQNGFAQSSPGGIVGASGTANGLPGSATGADGAGGGGGGGGVKGGGGGSVPGTDYGGSGGAGGTSLGTIVTNGNMQTPGNAGSPNLCAGCAVGGAGGAGAPGVPGDVVISYTTPPALTSNIASTLGCLAATATVTPTSGTAGYTYTWSPSGGNAANAAGLTNGTYTVNFTDSHGCTGTKSTTITLPSPITGTIATGPGLCGVASGTVTASGGTPGYTYTWSPVGGNAATTTTLVNGTYTVTIKDAMGCTGTATTSVVLPPALTITPAHSNVTCNGLSNATATATAAGGSGTYTVAINTTPPQFTLGSTLNVTGLAAGSYTFGVQDSHGCQDTVSFTVTQPAVLQQTVTPTTPICVGANSVLSDAVSGGTAPYNVVWSSGGGGAGALVTTTVTPATTTTYSATVTDAHNCTNTSTATVVVNSLPTVTVNSSTICIGNSTTLTAAGAITYSWNTGVGLSATSGTSVTANPVTTTVYTITGTDVNNCVNTATSTVHVNPTPNVTATSGTICIGGTTTLTANGATSYVWSPATGLSATSGASVAANPVTTTVYTITGTDANTCTSTATATVTVNSLPVVTVTSGTICIGQQTATLTANGANTYAWANSTGLSSTSGSSVNATPFVTTVYTVTGTDANNCVNTATSTVTVNSLPVVTLTGASICVGGSTTLTAGGATTYSWIPGTGLSATTGASVTANPASTTQYTVIGMDGNGCIFGDTASVIVITNPTVNVPSATICIGSPTTLTATGCTSYTWSPATGLSSTNGSTVTANPAATTVYTINGTVGTCTATTTATVVVNPLPVLTIGSNSPICENQTLNLTSTGGPGYSWSGPNGFSATIQNPSIATASPAATGVYSLTVTDANTCVSTASVNVVVYALPTVTATSATICIGGSANLSSNGALTYTWSPATGLNTTNGAAVTSTPPSTTSYTITGTDGNNCSNTGTSTVTVNSLPVVTVASVSMCIGGSTTMTANGANTYTWSPATGLSSTTGSMVTANPGATTDYTITGDNGCTSTTIATVTVNPLPTITASSAIICPGIPGTLTANGTSLTYTWSTGSTSPTVTLTPGSTTSYTVTGTDVNTCTNTATGTIVVNPALVLNVSSNSPVCVGNSLTFSLTSNPQSVNWQWNGPNGFASNAQNPSIANAQVNMSGTYSVGAVDVNGCLDTAFINVTVNPLPTPIASNNTPICENQNQSVNFIGFNISGGTYVWTGPNSYSVTAQNPIISNPSSTASGIYTLTVTDANNCSGSDTALVIVYPNPLLTINSPTTCVTTPIGIWVNGSNTYTWSPATGLDTTMGGNVVFSSATAGSYTFSVTGTNLNGCQTTTVTVINVYPISGVTVHSATLCAGNSTPLVASGASTYTWAPATGLSSTTGSLVIANPSSTTIYTVTGENSYGCAQIVPDTIVVNPRPALVLTPITATGCEPLCVAFSNTANAPGNYYWNFGDGKNDNTSAPTHCFSAGNFTTSVQVTDANGCSSTGTATIVAYPKPIANFLSSPQPTTIFDPIIHFQDGTSGGATIATWNWNFGDGKGTSTTQDPIYTYKDTGTYAVMLTVVSDRGCRDSIIIDVRIDDEYLIYVPNAFTPNHDGINDVFMPKGEGIVEYKLYVYDRWGQLAFTTNDLSVGWDGRHVSKGHEIAPEDVYIWKIEAKNEKGEPKILKGHVSLLK